MDEVPPSDRPVTNRQQTSLPNGIRSVVGRRPQPAPVDRVADFLRQEGRAFGRGILSSSQPSYERAENSYTSPTLFFTCMLLTIASIGVVTYYNITLGTATDMAAAVARDTPSPIPQTASSASVIAVPSPDHRPPPLVAALTMPSLDPRRSASGDTATASAGSPRQPAGQGKSEPAALHVSPSVRRAAIPAIATLPTGADLHLRIVYGTSDPAERLRIEAVAKLLQDQNNDVASATASPGPTEAEGVVYFFSNDRAAAGRIAASLARMTKRAEPVMLVHSNWLPRPGTVEIRLPSQG